MGMFTQLSVQMGNMTARMDRLERGGHRSRAQCHVVQEETGSCSDDADSRQGGRQEELDGDIHNFKLQVLAFQGKNDPRSILNGNGRSIEFSAVEITVRKKSSSWQPLNSQSMSLLGWIS